MAKVFGHIVHTQRVSTNIDDLQKIAENKNLSKKDLRVFIFLACRLESEHFTRIDKRQIAKSLDLTKDEVDNCLNTLMDENIIIHGSDTHVENGFRFFYSEPRGVHRNPVTFNAGNGFV